MRALIDIVQLLRIYQYTKNAFVFAPAFFAGTLLNQGVFTSSLYVFLSFCIISSVVYIINDIVDKEHDKNHPLKKNRPLASERISKFFALCILAALALLLVFIYKLEKINITTALVLLVYFFLNMTYSFFLKKISLLDVFILSSGFVLRIIAGGVQTNIVVSHWLLIMTFLISLFLSFAKRRDDVLLLQTNAEFVRASSRNYTLSFLDVIMSILVSVLIVSYLLYTLSPEVLKRFSDKPVYPSAVFVVLALFRYLQKALVMNRSADPSKEIFNDKLILSCVAFWILYFVYLIYV
jgi:4-hydroxybenzoate polyprenyltransferase